LTRFSAFVAARLLHRSCRAYYAAFDVVNKQVSLATAQ
jgi:hypothetical protein